MSTFLISAFYFVIVIGVMVLIHEFGHFAVAKLLGVRVEQFAIGFGKRLFGYRHGETDYRINALPFGGYVKMSGENPMDERSGDPREFLSHPRWHRFLIAIAGPVMNILFAIVVLTGVYMVHAEYAAFMDEPAVVGEVDPGSPAAKIGVQHGDRIVQIDGIQNPTWEQVRNEDALNPNHPLNVVIQRGDERFEKQITPEVATVNEVGSSGWYPDEPIVVSNLESGMPAAKAGIYNGDQIVAMNGQPLGSIATMIQRLQQTKDTPVEFTINRGSQTLKFVVHPVLAGAPAHHSRKEGWFHALLRKFGLASTQAAPEEHYRIGFTGAPPTKVGKLPFREAFARSLAENRTNSAMVLDLVGKLVQGRASPKTVSGPIGIAQITGEAAQENGWAPLLIISSMISLNLGIFNLLPIPIMDGGVILLLFIESLMRRDISMRIKERIYQAAFVFLVLFAAMVVYNDIAKAIAQKLP
ncbi:MAG TPA: RIP metalloprotease RseP [Terriglobales bacterium]|nr:RIP metalloprotease RseP [Terriglobales bacterium]